jgi:tetratricopeptide (TPR) repeat protein
MRHGLKLLFTAFLATVLAVTCVQAQEVKPLVGQGMKNCEKGRFDQAIADFTQAIKLKPNDATLYDLRGVAYYAKGDNEKALADHEQAIKLDPKYARTSERPKAWALKLTPSSSNWRRKGLARRNNRQHFPTASHKYLIRQRSLGGRAAGIVL